MRYPRLTYLPQHSSTKRFQPRVHTPDYASGYNLPGLLVVLHHFPVQYAVPHFGLLKCAREVKAGALDIFSLCYFSFLEVKQKWLIVGS